MDAASDYLVETPRLVLRPFLEVDVPALARIGADPRVAPMMGTIPVPWPEAEIHLWIDKARFRGGIGYRVAIALRDGKLIGCAGLLGAPAAISYFLDPGHWGRGYATEAVEAFLHDAFARFPGLDVVAADCFADNPGSVRVLGKLGFERTGSGEGPSRARLEPAPLIHYRLMRANFEASHEIP